MDAHLHPVLILLAIGAAFILVFLNGFFVAAEFSIVKVRRTRLEELQGQGVSTAKVLLLTVDQLDEYLSATQLGITIVSLALGWIGEAAFAELLIWLAPQVFSPADPTRHFVAVAISFFVITLLHVVLGELVPKSLAIQDAERVALRIARPLRWFYKVARPLIHFFNTMARFVMRRLGYHEFEEAPLSVPELKLVMKESKEEGVITESEAQIISRAFEFSDKRAIDIMVAKDNVDYISLARPLDQNLAVVRKHKHTRFPVCRTDFDTIIGVVHMKDVWPLLLTDFSNEAFEKNCRPAIFVNSAMRQDQLLKTFQGRRGHMAIVKDQHDQRNLGIVTLEDVLETLVGEIRDEHGN